ncbi:NRDE family protein [Tamilnaduibacter salinus]|nr:NRDE family protein [Tamilnaduibacter salinus]PAV26023.1 hypothetical protein CF392_07900 [Tamilnaduibacter salinus]
MCLILFAIDQHPDMPLVVAANRDEFYDRPTAPMHWWNQPVVLAGRDRRSGGTWLTVTPEGVVTAVTNFRDGLAEDARYSRGELPLLAAQQTPDTLAGALGSSRDQYAGYNLIRLNTHRGWYFSNRDAHPGRLIPRGIHGLSNHLLQTPWPKLVRTRQRFADCLRGPANSLHDALTDIMLDDQPAPDASLPDTGVGQATERFLSSPFIRSDTYGTRATTVVCVRRDGTISVSEQQWQRGGVRGDQARFEWCV